MNSTPLTVIGNVADRPSRRRLQPSGVSVTDFRVMSTSRVQDRESGTWSDGELLAVRVVCWRDLADRVFESVSKGDPVIVHGWFKGRSWVDALGARRYNYELEAKALGHNLTWGFATFERASKAAGAGVGAGVGAAAAPELDRIVLTGMARDGAGPEADADRTGARLDSRFGWSEAGAGVGDGAVAGEEATREEGTREEAPVS